MSSTEKSPRDAAQAGAPPAATRLGAMDALERIAAIQLSNRFIWLAAAMALLLIGQLSFVQLRIARFEHFTLMAYLTLIIELALLISALLIGAATPQTAAAWSRRYGERPFSYALHGLATVMSLALVLLLLLAPVLYLHRYPALTTQGISTPLMMLQRGLLLFLACLTAFNVLMILRTYLRIPWGLAACLAAAFHVMLGYAVTYLSFVTEAMQRLNDVFYYGNLWSAIPGFPDLQREEVFHNMEMPFVGYYLAGGVGLWLFTYMLWAARAAALQPREPRASGASGASDAR
jgi:hypothetical protein